MCQEILISTKGTKNSFILSSPMFSKVSQLVKVVNSDMATEQGEVLLLHKTISCIYQQSMDVQYFALHLLAGINIRIGDRSNSDLTPH